MCPAPRASDLRTGHSRMDTAPGGNRRAGAKPVSHGQHPARPETGDPRLRGRGPCHDPGPVRGTCPGCLQAAPRRCAWSQGPPPLPPALRPSHSLQAPRFPHEMLSFSFPFILFFPLLVLKTHQAPFLSALEQSSCPVRPGGHAGGIPGGLCSPAHDLRNQTNKSPREHRDEQTRVHISPSARNTAMHLSSPLCEDHCGISRLAGRGGTVLFLYELPRSSDEVRDRKGKSRALQGGERARLNSGCSSLFPGSSKAQICKVRNSEM